MTIDPGNAEVARSWDGDAGQVWTKHAAVIDLSSAHHHRLLLEAAAIADGEDVLDIGCGSGQTTRDAARATPSGRVLGLDLSHQMLGLAQRLTSEAGITNVEYAHADAQIYPFEPASFDVLISRFGSMFFADPVAAFTNFATALRRNGRLVLAVWQNARDNEWFLEIAAAFSGGHADPPPPGAPGPFSLGQPDVVRDLLGTAGFTDIQLEEHHEPSNFGTVDDGFGLISELFGWRLAELDSDAIAVAHAALRHTLTDHLTPAGALFGASAWLVTARKP